MQNYALTKVGDRERAAFPIKMPFFYLLGHFPLGSKYSKEYKLAIKLNSKHLLNSFFNE